MFSTGGLLHSAPFVLVLSQVLVPACSFSRLPGNQRWRLSQIQVDMLTPSHQYLLSCDCSIARHHLTWRTLHNMSNDVICPWSSPWSGNFAFPPWHQTNNLIFGRCWNSWRARVTCNLHHPLLARLCAQLRWRGSADWHWASRRN